MSESRLALHQFRCLLRELAAAEARRVGISEDESVLRILAREYDHWRDDDSPKGETVPGVRYKPFVTRLDDLLEHMLVHVKRGGRNSIAVSPLLLDQVRQLLMALPLPHDE